MSESFLNDRVHLHCGDCRDVLTQFEENSLDACVTDPPYHLTSIVKRMSAENAVPAQFGSDGRYARASAGFMGKMWDGGDIAFDPDTWHAVYRVLKPGAHLLAMGGTRTYHRLACAIEDAGFEIRDTIMWLYGSGFPKSHDVSKGIDRAVGAEREIVGQRKKLESYGPNEVYGDGPDHGGIQLITVPATAAARQWEGWHTALKPACEMIVLARKPLSEGTVAANVLRWGTGAINVGACRVATDELANKTWNNGSQRVSSGNSPKGGSDFHYSNGEVKGNAIGRWPANVIHDGSEEVVAAFPVGGGGSFAQSGYRDGGQSENCVGLNGRKNAPDNYGDSGSAARFFYQTKPDEPKGRWPANIIHDGSEEVVAAFPQTETHAKTKAGYADPEATSWSIPIDSGRTYERDDGSAARFFYTAKADSDDRLGSNHPTVKPLDLMQYLVRLITPPRGTVLDPFAGTGTTGEAAWREGMSAMLIEREDEYCADIRRRMALALAGPDERMRESIKARNLPRDDGPLFAPRETYNATDDFARSIDEAYRVIRERVKVGGPNWEPK